MSTRPRINVWRKLPLLLLSPLYSHRLSLLNRPRLLTWYVSPLFLGDSHLNPFYSSSLPCLVTLIQQSIALHQALPTWSTSWDRRPPTPLPHQSSAQLPPQTLPLIRPQSRVTVTTSTCPHCARLCLLFPWRLLQVSRPIRLWWPSCVSCKVADITSASALSSLLVYGHSKPHTWAIIVMM